jgi:hypothetical protein
MGVGKLRLLTLLSYGVMGMGGLWVGELSQGAIASPPLRLFTLDTYSMQGAQVAQTSDSSCRQTNVTTGVYEQPNLDSASRGILPIAQTVRLELLGTGTGWARINEPLVGWIEARYLTPNAPCDGLEKIAPQTAAPANATASPVRTDRSSSSSPATSSDPTFSESERRSRQQDARSFPSPDSPNLLYNRPANGVQAPSPQVPSRSPDTASDTQITTVSCDVLPAYGLIVRRQPTVVGDTYLTTIPTGTYQFQFTRNTQTNETPEGTRRWVYITAPVEGWISLGYVGKDFNLGGRDCG